MLNDKDTGSSGRSGRKEFEYSFNLIPDPIVIIDAKGKILAVSDGVEDLADMGLRTIEKFRV